MTIDASAPISPRKAAARLVQAVGVDTLPDEPSARAAALTTDLLTVAASLGGAEESYTRELVDQLQTAARAYSAAMADDAAVATKSAADVASYPARLREAFDAADRACRHAEALHQANVTGSVPGPDVVVPFSDGLPTAAARCEVPGLVITAVDAGAYGNTLEARVIDAPAPRGPEWFAVEIRRGQLCDHVVVESDGFSWAARCAVKGTLVTLTRTATGPDRPANTEWIPLQGGAGGSIDAVRSRSARVHTFAPAVPRPVAELARRTIVVLERLRNLGPGIASTPNTAEPLRMRFLELLANAEALAPHLAFSVGAKST